MYKSFLLSIFILVFGSCSQENNSFSFTDEEITEFRNLAWDDLSEGDKETVTTSKDEFDVSYSKIYRENDVAYFKIDKIKYPCMRTNLVIDVHKDHIFAIVEIHTVDDISIGPIFILVHYDSMKVYGRGIRN